MTSPLEQQDRERLIRIDERTASLVVTMQRHADQNREDFARFDTALSAEIGKVHTRVGRIERKQHLILGIGTGVGAMLGLVFTWARDLLAP